jgi:hypothetical protein
MPEWTMIGKVLIAIGVASILLGGMLLAADRIPSLGQVFSWFGRLPGDVSFKRENVSFYVPLGTSLLVSVILSLLFWVVGWFVRR